MWCSSVKICRQKNRGYPLKPLITASKVRYAPNISNKAIWLWFYYYMLEGETPTASSRRNSYLRACRIRNRGFSHRRNAWKSNDTAK